MKKFLFIFMICIFIPSTAFARKCERLETTRGVEKVLSSNWHLTGFLWKPVAEHQNKLVIITLPVHAVRRIVIQSFAELQKQHRLSLYSSGDLGDIWRDYKFNGRQYGQKFGPVVVTLKGLRTRTFFLSCPSHRSDGQAL